MPTCGNQPEHVHDFVRVAEEASSVTEASVRLQKMGHWYMSPTVVAAYQETFVEEGVDIRPIPRSCLPVYVESGPALFETVEEAVKFVSKNHPQTVQFSGHGDIDERPVLLFVNACRLVEDSGKLRRRFGGEE